MRLFLMKPRIMMVAASAALVIMAALLAGCAQVTEDGYRLVDKGSIFEIGRIQHASAPSGYPGLGVFAYAEGTKGDETLNIRLYDLGSNESTGSIRGLNPALCADGLYYYDDGVISVVAADASGSPVDTGVSGYSLFKASPGNVWLLLAEPAVGTEQGSLAINNREMGATLPLAWSEERTPANPSWVTDDRFVLDAVAPDDSGFDRAVYSLTIDAAGNATATTLKLGAQVPAENGEGLLACLEVPKESGKPALVVYDIAARERVALHEADDQATFGSLVWVAADTLAVEYQTQAGGTDIVLYRVES